MRDFPNVGEEWVIAAEPVDQPDTLAILRDYNAEMASRYYRRAATENEIDAALAEHPSHVLTAPTGLFLMARHTQTTVGCVGVRFHSADIAELTRMYVRPQVRGMGLGSRLLAAAERAARGFGATTMRMDTRHDLVEARALYTKHGYREIEPYNDDRYAELWFGKPLT